MMANEPGFGLHNGCFDSWMQKKDITAQHSMVEMAYAYGNGITSAGEVGQKPMIFLF